MCDSTERGKLVYYSRRWPRHKLTKPEGERILRHVLEHLAGIAHDLDGEREAMLAINQLLVREFWETDVPKMSKDRLASLHRQVMQ
jgi:hypothetical protein